MSKTPAQLVTSLTKKPYWWAYAIGIVLIITSGILWWTKVYLSPSQVFWGMLDSSLSTRSATIQTKQSNQQGVAEQYVQFELGGVDRAHSLATVKQGATTIETEIVGTPDVTYSQYRYIKTDQKNAAGKPLNTSKIEGVWAKRDSKDTTAAGSPLFAQAVLGVGLPLGAVPVPIGDVTPEQRAALLKQMRDHSVYDVSFKDVIKKRADGRLQYTYTTKIQAILYIRLMKNFAKDLGLSQLDDVDPNQFSGSQPINVQLTVDALSRHLVEVSVQGGGYSQRYSGYGVPVRAELPAKSISSAELQKRLQEL